MIDILYELFRKPKDDGDELANNAERPSILDQFNSLSEAAEGHKEFWSHECEGGKVTLEKGLICPVCKYNEHGKYFGR